MAVELEVEPVAHLVHFYAHDCELREVVGDYLATALASGDAVVVVATEAHRRVFEAAVAEAGVDVDRARRDGTLVVVDAAETLSRFTADGTPDPAAFDEVVGGLVRKAAATGRPVRAYGEMVALLWDAGQVNAAIELEGLWNELNSRMPFSLLCAYPAQSVEGDGNAAALEDVCRLHSGIVNSGETGPREERRRFACSPAGPAQARRFVVEALKRWGRTALAVDAAIVVTELATNAVLHAQSDFVVTLLPSSTGIRISVGDRSRTAPVLQDAGVSQLSGRGLLLVAAAASAWGSEPADDGKVVWAELREPVAVT